MVSGTKFLNESELISAILSGDTEAFRILVEEFQDKVKRTSKGFVHSEADAEDISQEVFVEVFESLKKFRSDSELSTWIYRITVNKSLNYLRYLKRRKIVSFFEFDKGGQPLLSGDYIASDDYSPENELINSEQGKAIKKAIDSLPINQKKAFVLSKYNDMTYQQVASVLGVSVSSVESLLYRAKMNLQKNLYTYYRKNMV